MKHKLLQLIKDNARAEDKLKIRVEAAADVAHIYVYDVIDQWWGASAAGLVEALTAAGGKDVHLHINSPGGDVFESSAMASAISAYTGTVTAIIDGIAASAATRLALAAKEVRMADTGLFMIHNSWTLAWGNKDELRATASLLDKVDGTIAADYTRKTGKTQAQVVEWMNAETWFTAAEAKDAGFVDATFAASQADGAQARAEAQPGRWNLSAYSNAPKLQQSRSGAKPQADKSDALSARQAALYDAFESVAEDFGKFDQGSGAAGAHYMAAADNPFGAQGIKCANCALYVGGRACEVVAGDIDPDAVCKLWIIPEAVMSGPLSAAALAAQAERQTRLNRSRLALLDTRN